MKIPTRLPPFTTKAEIFAMEEATKMMMAQGRDLSSEEYIQFERIIRGILKGVVWARQHAEHAVKFTGF